MNFCAAYVKIRIYKERLMYKFFIISVLLFGIFCGVNSPAYAACPVNCGCVNTQSGYDCNILYKDKCVLYNALNLTCEQAKCKEELEKKKVQKMSEVLPAYYSANDCLKKLEAANAPKKELKKQRKEVKKLEKQIEDIDECFQKEFKKHLTSLQKSKYNEIERLQKREIEKCQKCECRKLPDGMRPFAPGFGTQSQQGCNCGKKNCHCDKR